MKKSMVKMMKDGTHDKLTSANNKNNSGRKSTLT